MVSMPPMLRAFVAIVYVTPAAALESKVTFPPNTCGSPPNVIVWALAELKVMGAAKFQEADVDAFVQLPFVTVQDPPADEVMYPAALLIVTFPVSATADAFVLRIAAAPLSVSPPPMVRA
jgi:hypothetical protein